VVNGQLAAVEEAKKVLAILEGQLAMLEGQLAMLKGQLAVLKGQLAVVKEAKRPWLYLRGN
jgi:uncharacterized protein involved in exopolysaccharide biosynthesis